MVHVADALPTLTCPVFCSRILFPISNGGFKDFFLNDRCGWNRKKDNGANFAKLVLFVCAPIGSMTVIGLKMSHVLYTSDAHLQ